jgi:hypothetical protein
MLLIVILLIGLNILNKGKSLDVQSGGFLSERVP